MILTEEELKTLVLKNKLIDEKGLLETAEYLKNSDTNLYDALIEKGVATDEQLGILAADLLKIPFVVLSKISIPEELFHILPERVARQQKAICFARDTNGIKVAMTNPKNKIVLEMISKKTGEKAVPHLATERDIGNTFYIYRKDLQKTFTDMIPQPSTSSGHVMKDAPVSHIVDLIVQYAYQDRASDIHIEPTENESLVRFRIDGMLHDMVKLPKNIHDRIITRIKVLSRLRTDEHMGAQDGKMRLKMEDENMDIRVSILPVVDGEKAVLRLLSTHTRQFSLIDLGMNEGDLKRLSKALSKSYGMILSTGPTGSGKSTTIYTILKLLNRREKNITTVEDPVEYKIRGVNQINVNPKAGLTFASGLRSILRQDPNIIFVGEIRDMETASIAVNAALTGHLVVSTLHTNDAATTLPRLIDMKVEPFLVASTVNIIIAQRLLRKICDMCKTSVTINRTELEKNVPAEQLKRHFGVTATVRIYHGAGCKICHMTGYNGRIGVYEVIEMSNEIKKMVIQKFDSDLIAKQAIKEGMTTMFDDGMEKVKTGITTIEEVLRVTKVESI